MTEQLTKARNLTGNNIILILVVIYFVRCIFSQGTHSFTLTALFYYITIYVVAGIAITGLFGVSGIIKSQVNKTIISLRHKTFVVTAIIGLSLFGISYITRYIYFHKKFDSELWKNISVSMNFDANLLTPRQRMMEDLVENHLTGLTKTEVVSLLGDPDSGLLSRESESSIVYVLGPERGLGVDYQCLMINFDENYIFESFEDFPICG